jgi:hypothetical protein
VRPENRATAGLANLPAGKAGADTGQFGGTKRHVLVLIGVKGKHWEDIVYETSPSFWRMIEQRREETMISLAGARKRLEAHWAERDEKPRRESRKRRYKAKRRWESTS